MTNYEEFVKQSFKMKYPEDTVFPSEIGICFRKSYLVENLNLRKP